MRLCLGADLHSVLRPLAAAVLSIAYEGLLAISSASQQPFLVRQPCDTCDCCPCKQDVPASLQKRCEKMEKENQKKKKKHVEGLLMHHDPCASSKKGEQKKRATNKHMLKKMNMKKTRENTRHGCPKRPYLGLSIFFGLLFLLSLVFFCLLLVLRFSLYLQRRKHNLSLCHVLLCYYVTHNSHHGYADTDLDLLTCDSRNCSGLPICCRP